MSVSDKDKLQTGHDDWYEYKRLVLAALEQSDRQNEKLNKRLSDIEIAVVTLKTQASMWGALWGAIGGIGCSVIVAALLHALQVK
jgi:hypothetical protein